MKKYVDRDKLQEFTTKLVGKLKTMFSSPLVASTVAEMTDTNKSYVYTGSESGYTNGNWYFYNGSAWASGGVYNAVAVDTDKTLLIKDKAADSKAAGDAIRSIQSGLTTETTARQSADTTLQNNINAERTRAQGEEARLEALFVTPTQEAVDNWLDEHPEATTTVQDDSLTIEKFTSDTKERLINGYVTPQMYGAKANGVTDDSAAFQSAVNSGKPVFVPNGSYKLSSTIELKSGTSIVGTGSRGTENDGGYKNSILYFDGDGFLITGNHVTIKNLRIIGSNVGNGIRTQVIDEVTIPTISKINIENLMIFNFETGINLSIYLSNVSMVNVYDCVNGFRIPRGTSVKLYGCYSASCSYGYILGSVYSALINCACDHATECCYNFTIYAKNILCLSLGAESFKKKLIHINGAYNIGFDGVNFFTTDNTETDGIIYLYNAHYTDLRNINDRLLDGNHINKYIYVHYGDNNKIELSNIVNKLSKINLSSGEVRGKFVAELNSLPVAGNVKGDTTFSVSGSDFLNIIIPNLYSFKYDGSVILKINDLTGNLNYNTNRLIQYVNKVNRIVITTDDSQNNVFDSGESWTSIKECDTVFEFKDLVILPYSLPSITRPYIRVYNSKVIFTNCDFSQINPQGKQSNNMVQIYDCSTVIFNKCTLPSDLTKLYTKDSTSVVIGA